MDYEKAYKEALERARQFSEHPLCEDSGNIVEYIFPELAESEDVLTWLTKYIEEEAYSLSMDIRDEEDRVKLKNLQRSLTWLEKQSEQKQSSIMWHDVSEKPDEMRELLVEWESDDATWHTVGFYDAGTDKFREYKMPIDNVVRWMYVDKLLEKQRMEEQQ